MKNHTATYFFHCKVVKAIFNKKLKINLLKILALTFCFISSFNSLGQQTFEDKAVLPKTVLELPSVSQRYDLIEQSTSVSVNTIRLFEVSTTKSGAIQEVEVVDKDIQEIFTSEIEKNSNKFTVSELQNLAQRISVHYRNNGFLLANAYLPTQTIENGVVKLSLLKGTLGKVEVAGSDIYDESQISAIFSSLIDKPIKKDESESALLLLQRIPGASVTGTFSKGDKLGYSDLTLNVLGEASKSGRLYIDNYGSQLTGQFRAGVNFNLNNPLGIRDKLTFDLMVNEKPKGEELSDDAMCCFGGFQYQFTTPNLKHTFGFQYYRSNYDVGDADGQAFSVLNLSGESEKHRLFGLYTTGIDRSGRTFLEYGLSATEASTELFGQKINLDAIAEYDFSWNFENFGRSITFAKIGTIIKAGRAGSDLLWFKALTHDPDENIDTFGNILIPPSRVNSDENSSLRFTADLIHIRPISDHLRATYKLKAQLTDAPLVPIQQLGLGGPTGVRAYPTGASLVDDGVVLSADLTLKLSERFEIKAFADYAQGSNKLAENETSSPFVEIYGFGLGLDYKASAIDASITSGWSMQASNEADLSEGGRSVTGLKDPQIFGRIQYVF